MHNYTQAMHNSVTKIHGVKQLKDFLPLQNKSQWNQGGIRAKQENSHLQIHESSL